MDTPLKLTQEILFWYFQKICYKVFLDFKYNWKFWFYISSPGFEGESQFSGEIGTTYTLDTLKDMDVSSLIHILPIMCV